MCMQGPVSVWHDGRLVCLTSNSGSSKLDGAISLDPIRQLVSTLQMIEHPKEELQTGMHAPKSA